METWWKLSSWHFYARHHAQHPWQTRPRNSPGVRSDGSWPSPGGRVRISFRIIKQTMGQKWWGWSDKFLNKSWNSSSKYQWIGPAPLTCWHNGMMQCLIRCIDTLKVLVVLYYNVLHTELYTHLKPSQWYCMCNSLRWQVGLFKRISTGNINKGILFRQPGSCLEIQPLINTISSYENYRFKINGWIKVTILRFQLVQVVLNFR